MSFDGISKGIMYDRENLLYETPKGKILLRAELPNGMVLTELQFEAWKKTPEGDVWIKESFKKALEIDETKK
jgi:hypothetical protein